LKEFSIEEASYFGYISKAIDLFLEKRNLNRYQRSTEVKVDDLLALEVAKCFQSWYRPEDLYLIDFAQERQIIFPNPQDRNWKASNLGRYFLKLSPFEAIAFLCGLEIVLTLEHHKNTFVSKGLLDYLLSSHDNDHEPTDEHRVIPYSLTLFGLVKGFRYDRSITVTDFGYGMLSYIRSQLKNLRDLIMFLLESEVTGLRYEGEIDFDEFQTVVNQSTMLIDPQKASIQTGISLYKSGKLLDGLKVIYPVLEGTVDNALRVGNLHSSEMRGLTAKATKLEKERIISTKLAMGLEICAAGRNKVLHGNILEEDTELVEPLFAIALVNLKRLIIELHNSLPSQRGSVVP
jgi:hypothetical protein